MGDASEQERAHGDVDHGFGNVEAALVVPDQASPADHPAEGALHDPASREDLEATLRVRPADDLDDDVEEGRLVHEVGAFGGGVGEERLHGVAVEYASRRAGLAPRRLPVQHQRDIVDGAEQQPPDEATEPPVDRLPRPEMHRQHPPAAHGSLGAISQVRITTGRADTSQSQTGTHFLPLRAGRRGGDDHTRSPAGECAEPAPARGTRLAVRCLLRTRGSARGRANQRRQELLGGRRHQRARRAGPGAARLHPPQPPDAGVLLRADGLPQAGHVRG